MNVLLGDLRLVAVIAPLLIGTFANCLDAQTLGDVIKEAKGDWLIGDWVEQGDESTAVSFRWDLDRHAIVVVFKSRLTKARGMITYAAKENKVRYLSADNRGATGTGRWRLRECDPTLLYEQVSRSGKVTKAGFVHKRVDDKTMVIDVYELTDKGELNATPSASPKFVRRTSNRLGSQ